MAITALLLLASACSDDAPAAPASTPTPAAPTATRQPATPTPIPTLAPAPTVAPTPAAPPAPTATATRVALSATPTPTPTAPPAALPNSVDGYLASAPATLRAGQTETVAVSLLSGDAPAAGRVSIALERNGRTAASAERFIEGSGGIPIAAPSDALGDYSLKIEGPGFSDDAPLRVEDGTIVFVETDKPIYKPGQDMRIRVLRLDAELKPAPGSVRIEVQDAKGTKVFRRDAESDDFGMATVSMPLSTQPNLGVWKVTASYGDNRAQTDARVERYALPRYEVGVDLPKDWVLANEPISGEVSAEYSFGKPVRGDVEIVASRYVGEWQEFARFSGDIDGETLFDLPPVEYVAGVPTAGGQGNVSLDITVSERATGYSETTTRLLTVADAPIKLRLIPESPAFKPSLPFAALLVAQTPDNEPVERDVELDIEYLDSDLIAFGHERRAVRTTGGRALISFEPPGDAVAVRISAWRDGAIANRTIQASYSPTGSFIHIEQTGDAALSVGERATFAVHSTTPARNTYYEIVSRGKVVFSDFTASDSIEFDIAPLMAPSSRLLAYQIQPDGEVAADFIPFSASGDYPMELAIEPSADEVRPGERVLFDVSAQGVAKVGLAAVDRSVFILAENRLNLRQVFAELERLYGLPQVEIHQDDFFFGGRDVVTRGAEETFEDAGLVVMTNKTLPKGVKHESRLRVMAAVAESAPAASLPAPSGQTNADGLAEVQRVRQFFPETWLWADVVTDEDGRASLDAEAPDSITTWMVRAVALSKEHGLGVAETEMRVFQPFFTQVDLPYSAVRGEEFPVKVSLYNYLDDAQDFLVELAESDEFELLGESAKTVGVAGNDLGVVEFDIRLTELGSVPLEITARGAQSADAVIRELLVEPEGVSHEVVENAILSDGAAPRFDTSPPTRAVDGSATTLVALSGSYLSQTLEGLESLLRMPFGCGEQNMILFAPNVFVAQYLRETAQLKPEIMAKAEHLMQTGYQRELTYRRDDGSFSAFGDSDDSGSLWLTAFVLKTFAQAEGIIYIDDAVLADATQWLLKHQRDDGSFEPVGFLHHQELLGGLSGNDALTAYVAIALLEADESTSGRALGASSIKYLERRLDEIGDSYTLAITAYALALAESERAADAYDALLEAAIEDEGGLRWSANGADLPETTAARDAIRPRPSAAVETTGYATLALLERGDSFNVSRAARWLVSQRNAFGGFESTQDTVVGLQALIEFAANSKSEVDMTVELTSGDWSEQVVIDSSNADVTQTVEAPVGEPLALSAAGVGEVVAQVVRRFNLPETDARAVEMFSIDVSYDSDEIEVNDRIAITARLAFTPPFAETPRAAPDAGMIVLDVAVPTGFAPVSETIDALVEEQEKLKRYEIAGRKIILYIEDLPPNEPLELEFQAVALHPVRAQPAASQVYSYYTPHWRAETLGAAVTVRD